MRTILVALFVNILSVATATEIRFGSTITWDSISLMVDGHRVVPAMGEMHYARVPANEWRQEVRKMKEGGINILATYVFWIHHEPTEGEWHWEDNLNLRQFLEVCKQEQMPVLLRMGPFSHGEVRNGGLPDWLFDKGCKLRSENAEFLGYVRKLYAEIFAKVKGLQWQDGGPIIAAQFDNEYRGHGSYLLALKHIAEEEGLNLPFYTRTGWPELASPVTYGEMLPLYGDYADGFWDRSTEEGVGEYWKAFRFAPPQLPTAIATEQLDNQQAQTLSAAYPYFTCELGGGMMTSYHRRIHTYPQDAYAMAVVKLGSGSNLLGYYMYHGGINPTPAEGAPWLNENQRTPGTNYNDLPVLDYDFSAPIGACGQLRPHYFSLRKLHLFLQDFGEMLAPMQAVFPPTDDSLRWSYRTDGKAAFVFINNYARFEDLPAQRQVKIELPQTTLRLKHLPANCNAILPVNVSVQGLTIQYATAQLLAQRPGAIYFSTISGLAPHIKIGGKLLHRLRPKGENVPVATIHGVRIYLLEDEDAGHIFLPRMKYVEPIQLRVKKTAEATSTYRYITTGLHSVAEEPTDSDFFAAATYTIPIGTRRNGLLRIDYHGDCARLYIDKGLLLTDNFQNGNTLDFLLSRLPNDTRSLTLRILPLQPNMPIYFPREVSTTPGEAVHSVIIERNSRPTTTHNRQPNRQRKFFTRQRAKQAAKARRR